MRHGDENYQNDPQEPVDQLNYSWNIIHSFNFMQVINLINEVRECQNVHERSQRNKLISLNQIKILIFHLLHQLLHTLVVLVTFFSAPCKARNILLQSYKLVVKICHVIRCIIAWGWRYHLLFILSLPKWRILSFLNTTIILLFWIFFYLLILLISLKIVVHLSFFWLIPCRLFTI